MANTRALVSAEAFPLPAGWAVEAIHGPSRALSPNVDLVYEPGPSHRCRVWLNAETRDAAAWLWPILRAVEGAPVVIEIHVWADREPRGGI